MKLVVDVGNSRAKWARLRGSELGGYGSFVHRDHTGQGPSFEEHLERCWASLPRPETVLSCCVAGSSQRDTLRSWVAQTWGCPVEFVVSEAVCNGVRNAYPEPRTLGADRWAALLGARRLYAGTVCVVDCGTAVTVDVLREDGAHLGGVILPGLELMRLSLRAGTGEIRLPAEVPPSGVLASSTTGAVASGTLQAVVGAVERVHAQCTEELGDVECVMTGGDAQPVMRAMRVAAVYEPHLVLLGLGVLAGGSP